MKRLNLKYFFVISIFILAGSSAAYSQEPLSLEKAVNIALENNTDIKRQKIILDASERAAKYSLNSLVPSVSVSAQDTFTGDLTQTQNDVAIAGNVSLNLKADIFSASKKAKIDFEIEKLNYEQLCSQVRTNVWNSYLEIIALQQEISFRTQSLKNTEDMYNENTEKFKKGFLSENEYLISKITFEKQKIELNAKTKELENLLISFFQFLGVQQSQNYYLSTDLFSLIQKADVYFEDNCKSKIMTLTNNKDLPSLTVLKLQKQSAEENLKAKKTEVWSPGLDLTYSGGPVFDERKFSNSVTVGASINLDPFLGCSKEKEEIRLAQDSVKDMELQIKNQEQLEINRVNTLLSDLESKKETADAFGLFISLAEKNNQLCLKSYSSGVLDFQSLKNASTELLEVQTEYIGVLTEILKTYAEIQEITGIKIKTE